MAQLLLLRLLLEQVFWPETADAVPPPDDDDDGGDSAGYDAGKTADASLRSVPQHSAALPARLAADTGVVAARRVGDDAAAAEGETSNGCC